MPVMLWRKSSIENKYFFAIDTHFPPIIHQRRVESAAFDCQLKLSRLCSFQQSVF